MNDERMKILQMVEENKITVEEAIQLLDAVKCTHRHPHVRIDGAGMEEKIGKFTANVDNFAREFGGKMEQKFKDMEPTLRKATKAVVEKTAKVVNDISNALNESIKNMENKECCCNGEQPGENGQPGENNCCCGDDEPKEN